MTEYLRTFVEGFILCLKYLLAIGSVVAALALSLLYATHNPLVGGVLWLFIICSIVGALYASNESD